MIRKKITIFVVIILLIVGFFLLKHLGQYVREKREQKIEQEKEREREDAVFDSQMLARYGSEGYLGRMSKEIKPLPKDSGQPDEYDELEGHYNEKKITNLYEAREVVYRVREILEIPNERDIFLYGSVRKWASGDGIIQQYILHQFYKGTFVECGDVTVCVDVDGNTMLIMDDYIPEERLETHIESVVPKYEKKKVEKLLAEKYEGRAIQKCALYITDRSRYVWGTEEKYILVWIAEIGDASNSLRVCIDANTGEILDEDDGMECIISSE